MAAPQPRLSASCLLCFAAVTQSCSNVSDESDYNLAQASSTYGATKSWNVSEVPWSAEVQALRNRAYSFCARKRPHDEICTEWQDQSIKVAVDVDRDVQEVIKFPEKAAILGLGKPSAAEITRDPKRFDEAREHCFSVYKDAGSADARSLGPCMASTLGWDYFGFHLVP